MVMDAGQPGNAGGPPAPSPPMFYWVARGIAKSRTTTAQAFLRGVDRAIDAFEQKSEAQQAALGLNRETDRKKRAMAYYNKPDDYDTALMLMQAGFLKYPYSWESQKAYFPNDWAEDWTDFQNLRILAREGELGPQLKAQEQAYLEQHWMQDFQALQQEQQGNIALSQSAGAEPNTDATPFLQQELGKSTGAGILPYNVSPGSRRLSLKPQGLSLNDAGGASGTSGGSF